MPATAPDFQPGQLLPGTKYRVVRQIGAGGMGVVYQVVKPPEIQGVLKLMSSELTAHEEFRTRFLDEVRVLAQLDHPNIVRVFDYDSLTDGTPYYVMELLHGRTVRDALATMGTIPPRVAFEITRQLCEALHCAHTNSIPVVHRDIKPENIFLHSPRHGEPVVKLIDFGVVAVADRKHDGTFVGTWKYAAPEQIRGERALPATDLYAVGLVLYEMLCGVGPFEQYDTGPLISRAHVFEEPPPVSRFAPWVPASIVQLIDAALAKDPRRRPRDAYAFAERLYELEFANDGNRAKDPTTEGPLATILSTASRGASPARGPSSLVPGGGLHPTRNAPLSPPVPFAAAPPSAPTSTLKGVGQQAAQAHETIPGEDELLAGLAQAPDAKPLSRRARQTGPDGVRAAASDTGGDPLALTPHMPDRVNRPARVSLDAPTLDAPPSAPRISATPAPPLTRSSSAGGVDTDTFATQESDAARAPRRTRGRLVPVVAACLLALGALGLVAALRSRGA
ncbi:MAG: serine/threonine protein kinase, partial [Labilithrix sp.]|nr:serine/threonine protein kinase [Labilithrix sp.]